MDFAWRVVLSLPLHKPSTSTAIRIGLGVIAFSIWNASIIIAEQISRKQISLCQGGDNQQR